MLTPSSASSTQIEEHKSDQLTPPLPNRQSRQLLFPYASGPSPYSLWRPYSYIPMAVNEPFSQIKGLNFPKLFSDSSLDANKCRGLFNYGRL